MTDDLEAALHAALRPVDPPDGFTERVVARVTSAQRHRLRARWRIPAGMAAAVLLAIGIYKHIQQQRREGLETRRAIVEALRLTDEKLDLAYQTVREASGT
jgi:hypothetical protein